MFQVFLKQLSKVLWVAAALLLSTQASATQNKIVSENKVSYIVISNNSTNRLVIAGDRIAQIKGDAGKFLLDQDVRAGHVFVKPADESVEKFNLFVSTEKGLSFQVNCKVKNISAQTVVFKQLGDAHHQSGWEKNATYQTVLSEIIKAAAISKGSENFLIEDLPGSEVKIAGTTKTIKIFAHRQARNDLITCTKYHLKNTGAKTITLKEPLFYSAGVRAVALQENILPAGSVTELYIVRENNE